MRKGQEKILEKAEKCHFSQEKKDFLAREDLSIKELNFAFAFLLKYDNPDYKILEEIVTNKQCQKWEYSFYIILCHDTIPKMEDLYAVFQNPNVPDNNKGIIITMLGNGWEYLDCCQFFEEYRGPIERWFEKNFGRIKYDTGDTDVNFYTILKYANNETGKLGLWKEYAKLALSDNRIVLSIVDFAVENEIQPADFKKCNYEKELYLKTRISCLNILSEDFLNTNLINLSCKYVSNLEKLKEVVSILNNENGITVHNNPVYEMYVSIAKKAININLEYYSSAYYDKMHKCWNGQNKKWNIKIVVFHDGGIYYESKNKKLVPLSIKKLLSVKHTYGPYGEKAFQFVMKNSIEQMNAPVLKDICRLIEETDMFLPPVTFNECKNIHNLNELFQQKWKETYCINWNRTNVNLGYMVIKSLSFVQKEDRNKLLAIKDVNLLDTFKDNRYFKWTRRIGYSFLAQIILSHIPELNEEERKEYTYLINDYMEMSYELHQPIKIGFRSKKKIEDAHEKITQAYNQKKDFLHKISIPKKSRFNQLRKLLPSSFEWIRNGTRLYREGIKMHHCVNSYYDYINNDVCAIYSVCYEGKRYTIEFQQTDDGHYYVAQIQSQCDRGCPVEVKEWVNSFLK